MRKFYLIVLSIFLGACTTTTTPTFTKQQDKESQALAVLANYSGDVLAAAALPLQYYCQHKAWPASLDLDTTQPVVANLSGLYYTLINQYQYQANFSLIDQTVGSAHAMINWLVVIPRVDPTKVTVQKVKLEIINNDLNIHLLNMMDFSCHPGVAK